MTKENNIRHEMGNQDFYFIVKDKEHDIYWVLNLEDHPNSFLLDQTYQHYMTNEFKEGQDGQESMIVIQPTA